MQFKVLQCNNFSDFSLNRILESENLRFPLTTTNSLTWGVKSQKVN